MDPQELMFQTPRISIMTKKDTKTCFLHGKESIYRVKSNLWTSKTNVKTNVALSIAAETAVLSHPTRKSMILKHHRKMLIILQMRKNKMVYTTMQECLSRVNQSQLLRVIIPTRRRLNNTMQTA